MSLSENRNFFMEMALEQAQLAYNMGEVPVGAVITNSNGEVISKAHNLRETTNSPLAHAEVLCIEKAAQELGSWRLSDCTLYVTLEPCMMCSGAIISARIPELFFGALDPKSGYVQSLHRSLEDSRLNHQVKCHQGLRSEESSVLLKQFFKKLRK